MANTKLDRLKAAKLSQSDGKANLLTADPADVYPQPDIQPVPPVQQQPQFTYSPEIASMRQQATGLEQQAAQPPNPYAGMSPLRAGITGLLRAGTAGFDPNFLPREAATNRQASMDKLARAKDLRGQSNIQEQHETEQQRWEAAEQHQQAMEEQARQNAAAEAAYRQQPHYQYEQGRPGQAYGSFITQGQGAGTFKELGKNPAEPDKLIHSYNKYDDKTKTSVATGVYQKPDGSEYEKAFGPVRTPPDPSDQYAIINTVDDAGNKAVKIVPKVPSTFAAAPTAQESNRRDQAGIVSKDVDHIVELIDKNPGVLGPFIGRLYRGEIALGAAPPEARQLFTALKSFEALQPILHGFRGGSQTLDHFTQAIGGIETNPGGLKASLAEIKWLAETIKAGEEGGGGGGRIRVRNKATGQTGTISAGAFNPQKYDRIQ